MSRVLRYLGQAVVYLGIALVFATFSKSPSYVHFPPDRALIKVSLVHSAQRREECRRLSAEEIAELPPNMRKPLACARERLPIWLEVLLDDRVLIRDAFPPTGFADDGPARIYERFEVRPGRHLLTLRLRDSRRTEGFDYEFQETVELQPQQNLVVDFRTESGGFILR